MAAKQQLEAILEMFPSGLNELPKRYVYEQLSRVCHYLGEEEDAQRYSRLAVS